MPGSEEGYSMINIQVISDESSKVMQVISPREVNNVHVPTSHTCLFLSHSLSLAGTKILL
jgi:hypothetical protein